MWFTDESLRRRIRDLGAKYPMRVALHIGCERVRFAFSRLCAATIYTRLQSIFFSLLFLLVLFASFPANRLLHVVLRVKRVL